MPIVCTGNDFSTLYAPLIRESETRAGGLAWKGDAAGACRGLKHASGASGRGLALAGACSRSTGCAYRPWHCSLDTMSCTSHLHSLPQVTVVWRSSTGTPPARTALACAWVSSRCAADACQAPILRSAACMFAWAWQPWGRESQKAWVQAECRTQHRKQSMGRRMRDRLRVTRAIWSSPSTCPCTPSESLCPLRSCYGIRRRTR